MSRLLALGLAVLLELPLTLHLPIVLFGLLDYHSIIPTPGLPSVRAVYDCFHIVLPDPRLHQ